MSAVSHPEPPDPGLCSSCRYTRRIHSARNSVFFLCQRAAVDPNFPRYPELPVRACSGYATEET